MKFTGLNMDTWGFFKMRIRPATLDDFEEAYALGKNTPELKVSSTEEFMDRDDFQQRIGDPLHVFLIAEQKKRIIGFICANTKDLDSPLQNKYACLVYLVTLPKFRRQGVAKKLYIECERQLRERGITHFYGWANAEGEGAIIKFMKKQNFTEGHKYVWMDKKIIKKRTIKIRKII